MLLHNICFRVFRSLEFAFLCLKMLENASLRGGGGCEHSNCPSLPMGLQLKFKTNFIKQIKSILQAIPCLYNNQHTLTQHYVCIPCLRQTQGKLYTLFRTDRSKAIPCPVVHPCLGHIREYPPSENYPYVGKQLKTH